MTQSIESDALSMVILTLHKYSAHLLSPQTIITIMAKSDSSRFQAYKDERKWNYIFLLHARYNGSIRKLATVSGISQTELKNWNEQYRDEVMQFINANRVIRGDEVIEREQSGVVPTVKELIDKLLIKLDTAIAGESDPSSLSRTLQNLYSYDVSIKAANQDQAKKSSCSTVAEAVEKKFKK